MQLKKIITNLGIQILFAMLIGIVVGFFMKEEAAVFAPLGDIFIQLIKMLVIPLVAVSLISGAASLSATRLAGKTGIVTFLFYLGTTAFAVSLGLLFGELFKPGAGLDINTVQNLFPLSYETQKASAPEFWILIKNIIPTNPIKALVEGQILQVLFFCLFLGISISKLPAAKRDFLLNIFNYLTEALIHMIKVVMWTAPLGVFGLMANAVGTFGFEILALVSKLFIIYIIAILLHGFGFYPFLLKVFSGIALPEFLKKISKAQLVALSTASSMATLPVTFEVCEEELKVSKQTASFVLPLGATINMDGNAIYYALAATFFAQMFGLDLGLAQYIAILLTATIGSIGQAGVPGPSLLVVAVLVAADIPVAGLPLLYAVDRVFDMIRTALNITGDATCAVIIDGMSEKQAG